MCASLVRQKFNEVQMRVANQIMDDLIENDIEYNVKPDKSDKAIRIKTAKASITVKSTGATIVKADKGVAAGSLKGQRVIHTGETVGDYGIDDAGLIVDDVKKL